MKSSLESNFATFQQIEVEITTQDIILKNISTSESLIHCVLQKIKGCRLLENLDIALFKYLLMLLMSCAV